MTDTRAWDPARTRPPGPRAARRPVPSGPLGRPALVAVAVIGFMVGAAAASALTWEEPDRLPEREAVAAIAAVVFPPEPDRIDGGGPARVDGEDFPLTARWQEILLGSDDQGDSAGASWSDAYAAADEAAAYRRLAEAETRLRAEGWIIDGYTDSVRRIDGVPTPPDGLHAHKGAVGVDVVSTALNSPHLSVRVLAEPQSSALLVAGGVLGAAAALWLALLRRRVARRAGVALPRLGVAALPFTVPSLVATGLAAFGPRWAGAPAVDYWDVMRTYYGPMCLGLFLNLALALAVADAIVLARRVRRARGPAAGTPGADGPGTLGAGRRAEGGPRPPSGAF